MTTGRVTALEAARALASARFRRRPPVYLVHALTARCNARCGFCAWNPDFYDPSDQLPTDAIEQLYTDAREAGFIGLSVWGGEPLLHRDFGRVMRHAKGLGLHTNMVTNGFLLDRKMDDVLAYVDRIAISVDHPSSRHDEMRGIPGLFDKIVGSTREIRRRAPQMPIAFVYTMQRENIDAGTLREMAELLRSLGVVGVFNGLREEAATDDADAALDAYAAPPDQLARAFVTIAELKRQGYPIQNSHTYMGMMQQGPPIYRCHWPKLLLPVEANGDVVDCMHWGTRPLGNVRQTPFAEILRSPRLRELAGEAGESCHKCVSIHRVEISEVARGNLEPVRSWRALVDGAPRATRGADAGARRRLRVLG
ncbi:MAG: radical SAM protein [Myxococcota bacterium]